MTVSRATAPRVIDADGAGTIYRKAHLWDREQTTFIAGGAPPPVLDTAAGRIGVAICYDAFFPEVMRGLALAGADVIAVPMNSPVATPPPPPNAAPTSEIVLALAAATVNRVYVVQADRSGPERGITWSQASAICDPDGRWSPGRSPVPACCSARWRPASRARQDARRTQPRAHRSANRAVRPARHAAPHR